MQAAADGTPVVLVVGAASRDVTPFDPRGWRLGGAVCYGALALARFGVPVRALVGVDGPAAAASELDLLRRAGVEVELVPLSHGPVFENRERPEGREQLAVDASEPIPPSALPARWRAASGGAAGGGGPARAGAGGVVFAPVAGELPPEWADVPAPGAFVALGWQGLLRRVERGQVVARVPPAAHPLVDRASLVGVSVDEIGPELRLSHLVDVIPVGATVVVTRGDRGGTAVTSRRPARSALRAYPAIPADEIVDPTGAGDVFLAALVATAVAGLGEDPADWSPRLTLAAAAASLCVERPGLAGVPTLAAARRRAAESA